MSKVLKGLYFADEPFLTARLKKINSYAWRSLLVGKNLLTKGMRVVIGSGKTVNVWSDSWLPTHTPRPPRPLQQQPQEWTVNQWMNDTGSGWNEALIRTQVVPEDVEIILSVKITSNVDHDLLGWHYNDTGIYTVKSGYWLATHLPELDPIEPPPDNVEVKRLIWKTKTAPKQKHFMWKLISDSLPIGQVLADRHITQSVRCPHCYQYESYQHAFFDCYYAQQIWRASNIPLQVLFNPAISYVQKLKDLLSQENRLSDEHHTLGIWILWRLWKARNTLIFQKELINWRKTLLLAKLDNAEWRKAQEFVEKTSINITETRGESRRNRWRRPPQEWTKCNYDGAYNSISNTATAGWLFRDIKGTYMGAGSTGIDPTFSALEGEFKALIIAMQSAWSRGYRKVLFEGDCKTVVDLVTGKKINFGLHNYVREVWNWNKKFQEVQHCWIGRESNKPADILATKVCRQNRSFTFHTYVPLVITDALHNDFVISNV